MIVLSSLVALFGLVSADYSPGGDVVVLTSANFKQKVLNSDELWLVEFYAPWCGHCQRLEPEFKKVAKELKGTVNVGAVDMTQHQDVGAPYGIKGFPTLKFFGYNKNKPIDYNGARSSDAMGDEAFKQLRKLTKDKASGGKSSGGSGGSSGGSSGGNKNVVLTDQNFQKKVIQGGDPWLVEFYAPWCGHCQRLEPEWKKAAGDVFEQTGNKVKMGALDATAHQNTASQYQIQGYPTIKIFYPDGRVEDYNGGRTASDLVAQALILFEDVAEPPELKQLTSKAVLDDTCNNAQICAIAFFPHILDDQAKGRNDRIKLIKDVIEIYKRKKWGWLWVEAGQQSALEKQLNVNDFPNVMVVNPRKHVSVKMLSGFHKSGLEEFFRNIAYGKTGTAVSTFDDFAEIAEVQEWDGKDGKLEVDEDEYDLDDFDWGDDDEEYDQWGNKIEKDEL